MRLTHRGRIVVHAAITTAALITVLGMIALFLVAVGHWFPTH